MSNCLSFRLVKPQGSSAGNGATRCTDQGEIWQGGAEVRSSLPNFKLIGSGVWVYGPKNFENLPI